MVGERLVLPFGFAADGLESDEDVPQQPGFPQARRVRRGKGENIRRRVYPAPSRVQGLDIRVADEMDAYLGAAAQCDPAFDRSRRDRLTGDRPRGKATPRSRSLDEFDAQAHRIGPDRATGADFALALS